jgi:hypothetical protein
MTKQIINVGTSANDRTGDTIRAAMIKVKSNFDELYSAYGSTGTVPVLAAVAKSGDYNDLINKPPIPTVVSSFQNDAGYLATTQSGVPSTSLGRQGDSRGMTAFDDFHFYFCSAPYDGVTNIWKRIAWTDQQW